MHCRHVVTKATYFTTNKRKRWSASVNQQRMTLDAITPPENCDQADFAAHSSTIIDASKLTLAALQ